MNRLLEWRKEFALGIAEVDFEHREMIELINALYEAVEAGADLDAVLTFLAEVHARIAAHFALEERLMQEIRYDEYPRHKADHERLLDEILALIDACEDGEELDSDALSRALDDWFTVHFRTFDARLHAFTGEA